jgi:hypothetical protein
MERKMTNVLKAMLVAGAMGTAALVGAPQAAAHDYRGGGASFELRIDSGRGYYRDGYYRDGYYRPHRRWHRRHWRGHRSAYWRHHRPYYSRYWRERRDRRYAYRDRYRDRWDY